MIYLASASKERKRLLKIFGLRFRVMPSCIKEEAKRGKLSYVELVKSNALRKAQEVAGRVKSGIIIAADTISVQGGQIFGKPKDLTDASRMLKRFSGKPQDVYTGIAVIDKDAHKTLTDYERTSVWMDRLTDKEITDYFRKVSPLDKAGSYDIQGRGAFFISRIDGCFYNVVGLPLRKLYRMLKRLKVIN
jgi:septum formation protein